MSVIPASPKKGAPAPIRPRWTRGDHEFLPAAIEILETPLSPVKARLIVTLCGFVTVALAWSYIGQIDIVAVAQGKIQPVGRTKTIQPLETGKVLRLAAENGQAVKAGDLLAALDPSDVEADIAALENDLVSRQAEASRRMFALTLVVKRRLDVATWPEYASGTPANVVLRENRVLSGDLAQLVTSIASIESQKAQKVAQIDRLDATINAQRALVATLKQRVDMRSELFGRDSGSRAAVIDAQESFETQQTGLAYQIGQLGEAKAAVMGSDKDIEKTYATFVADNSQKLADAERQVEDDRQKLSKAQTRLRHLTLTSPIDGVVQGLTVTTAGQVVSSGEQIMQVVPSQGGLEIEGYMPNGNSGFVKPGQPAIVKVESFPFTDYGTLDAHVVRIAKDAIPEVEANEHEQTPTTSRNPATFGGGQRMQNLVFAMTLSLDQSSIKVAGDDVPLIPGMAVTIEVKTGTRRILSYLFSPLVQALSTAMRER